MVHPDKLDKCILHHTKASESKAREPPTPIRRIAVLRAPPMLPLSSLLMQCHKPEDRVAFQTSERCKEACFPQGWCVAVVQRLQSSDFAKTPRFTIGCDWLLPSPTSTKRTRASVNIYRANKIQQVCMSASCKYAAPAADLHPLEDPLHGKSARQGFWIWMESISCRHVSCLPA